MSAVNKISSVLANITSAQDWRGGRSIRPTALGASAGSITNKIQNTASGPGSTESSGHNGELQAGDGEGTKERRMVLREVGVRALSAVELKHPRIASSCFLAGVCYRVFDAAGLSEAISTYRVE